MPSPTIKRVAVIGTGPAGIMAIDALAKEHAFDIIRVFERQSSPGGCWVEDSRQPPALRNFAALASRTADSPLPIPDTLPAQTPKNEDERFDGSSIYEYLETNVHAVPMEFSQEPFPTAKSPTSIATHGADTPFRHWRLVKEYLANIMAPYCDYVSYGTTVERAEKVGSEWKVVLRKSGERSDYWWVEWFDAVVVASGHYTVPYIPEVEGLEEYEKLRPGSVLHSKHFRGRDAFAGKNVVVVGGSVSAADIATDLVQTANLPVHAITVGHSFNGYFGGGAFEHPHIANYPSITSVCPTSRTVTLIDGSTIPAVDHVIFGTGYSWTLPFLPSVPVRNNRVPDLWNHVVWTPDPTLTFVGAIAAGLTFKIFEWQAVFVARLLSGRATLPSAQEMKEWEVERMRKRGDGVKFTLIYPDYEDYFEDLRTRAGPGERGARVLPKFKREWHRAFLEGHQLRIDMWARNNARARACGASVASVDSGISLKHDIHRH